MANSARRTQAIEGDPVFRILLVSTLALAATTLLKSQTSGSLALPAQRAQNKANQTAGKWTPPRMPWGDPDLEGVWPSTNMIGTPLERDPKLGTRAILSDAEFAERAKQEAGFKERFESSPTKPGHVPLGAGWADYGEPNRQASLVVDPPNGRIPPLTPEAQKRESERLAHYRAKKDSPDSWADLTTWDRCITLGVVGSVLPFAYNNGSQIIQSPGYVVFRSEMIHEARIIPLDGRPHAGSKIRMWMGDSRGHWEGNTLVVETTNFNGKVVIGNGAGFDGAGTLPTSSLRLVERFTRVSEHTLDYQVTIDDPKTWTAPWTIAFPFKQDPNYQVLYEYACHEGNIFMHDALSGARAKDKDSSEQTH